MARRKKRKATKKRAPAGAKNKRTGRLKKGFRYAKGGRIVRAKGKR